MSRWTAKKVSVREPSDEVIPLWPLPFDAAESNARKSSWTDFLSAKTVVCAFALIWLAMVAFSCHANLPVNYYFWKLFPVIFLFLLAKQKGITHIIVGRRGLTVECRAGKSEIQTKGIFWNDYPKILVVPAKKGNVLDSKLVINDYKISLKKFNGPERWRAFVAAVKAHQPHVDLDETLLDSVSQRPNPTFTKIWLESLAAPPRRQRLQPLSDQSQLQNGRFTVKSILGTGGQGNAYLAQSAEYGAVVLKEFILPVYVDIAVRKQSISDFEQQSAVLSKLHHPGSIRLYDTFVEDQRGYLVMELASGPNLKQMVRDGGVLSEQDTVGIGIQLGEILSCLHGQSPPIVHQDFTPDNLIMTEHGLKLIDFGGAHACDNLIHTVVGKRNYMPPEQFRGKPTTQSDIFALGGTLHYLVTGEDPEPISQCHPQQINGGISPAFNRIVERATSLDLHERYATAAELLADLRGLEGGTLTVQAIVEEHSLSD